MTAIETHLLQVLEEGAKSASQALKLNAKNAIHSVVIVASFALPIPLFFPLMILHHCLLSCFRKVKALYRRAATNAVLAKTNKTNSEASLRPCSGARIGNQDVSICSHFKRKA